MNVTSLIQGNTKATTRLRQLLRDEQMVVAGGAHDALSARICETVGFKAVYVSGLGLETVYLGTPDLGLLTHMEIASHVGRMADAADIPVVADAEAGFGGAVNVTRMIREFEKAGVAGIHLEDQTNPKRCPHIDGVVVTSREEAVNRIRAACAARTDPDFVIIARSDADAVSYAELVTRSRLYLEAGADLVMPMLHEYNGRKVGELSHEEHREVHANLVRDIGGPVASGRLTPGFTEAEMRDLGYKWLQCGMFSIAAYIESQFTMWKSYFETGKIEPFFASRPLPKEVQADPSVPRAYAIMEYLRLNDWLDIEREYGNY